MKDEDKIKIDDDLKNEDYLKNKYILKNEDNTKMSTDLTTLPEKAVDDSLPW